ncbi:hypothetical protein N0V90_000021 [Kalmusia sp. IMI 367209]|nr:hypothetical protein N0V90_000021 [Kalmusia sp. IMI 367209]
MATSIRSALPSSCTLVIPGPEFNRQTLSRWSDILVQPPHAIVTPTNAADIIATIEYATRHKLRLIPAGGGRGSYVPITDNVIYLDLKNFDGFQLDEEKGEVQFGGGCISGPLLKGLAKRGYYTAAPNSNGVGMAGSLLGGLNHPLGGLHGMGIDMLRSITVIPFSAPNGGQVKPITLSKESKGEGQILFNAFRGAGHGLGVIISAMLEVHPLAHLNLDEGDKVWQRSLVFAPSALPTAIETYLSLQSSVPPEMNFFLGFMRAPPTAPLPGAPVILLSISFFGPSSAAEKATAITFSPDIVTQIINTTTTLTPFTNLHDALDPINRSGGYKELHGAMVHSISASSIEHAFASFLSFTNENPSRFGSSILFPASSTNKNEALAAKSPSTVRDFYNLRDRGIYVQVKTSYADENEKTTADLFAKEVHEVAREEDRKAGRKDRAFANNWVEGMEPLDMYTDEQIADIARVKKCWDGASVGWAPAVDSWKR